MLSAPSVSRVCRIFSAIKSSASSQLTRLN